jgi:hypothetical protein
VDFKVTAKGPTFDQLIRDTTKDLRAANKKAGGQIRKVGGAAMRKGAPTMWGRKLAIKVELTPSVVDCRVEFTPAPRNAGGWAIQESGRRGGYDVKPIRAEALHGGFPGAFAARVHIERSWGGRQAWTHAGERLAKALNKTVADVYDDALGA